MKYIKWMKYQTPHTGSIRVIKVELDLYGVRPLCGSDPCISGQSSVTNARMTQTWNIHDLGYTCCSCKLSLVRGSQLCGIARMEDTA